MDRFFDRVGDVLRSLLGEQNDGATRRASSGAKRGDADFDQAWEELEGFLNDDAPGAETAAGNDATADAVASQVDPKLKHAYETLGVAIGTPLADVRRSYKKLMQAHHPDRFAGDTAAQQSATSRAARINAAYQLIQTAAKDTAPE